VASLAVRFQDTLSLTAIVLQLFTYGTPIFYPLRIVPGSFRLIIDFNPLTYYVGLFRDLVYTGTVGPIWKVGVVLGTCLAALGLGAWIFARGWRTAAVML
jgi:homopolymeric O-antigen transport system permease protein